MFNEKLQPMYQGRVLMNESALNDPVLIAVLDEMALRDFKDRPQPNAGTLYISDRHYELLQVRALPTKCPIILIDTP